MDQWLALNTAPNFLDFNIALETADFEHSINGTTDAEEQSLKGASIGLHFNIIGFEGQYKMAENSSTDEFKSRTGIFHLRILGHSTQSTHIALQYGVHLLTDQDNGKYDEEFSAVSADFYFLPFFGFEGAYRN